MSTRRSAREFVVSMLYAKDVGNHDAEEYIEKILKDKKISGKQRKFALDLFSLISNNMDNIDIYIDKNLKRWKLDSISSIEKSILRLGAGELINTKTESAVIISEAIGIAKDFCTLNSAKLINGVLDAIRKDIR